MMKLTRGGVSGAILCAAAVWLSCTSSWSSGLETPRSDTQGVQQANEVRPSVLPTPRQGHPTRIELPRLQIDVHLSESSLIDNVPDGQAFVLEGTAWPCETGTSFVYGHARTGTFLPLWGVRRGDLVRLEDAEG